MEFLDYEKYKQIMEAINKKKCLEIVHEITFEGLAIGYEVMTKKCKTTRQKREGRVVITAYPRTREINKITDMRYILR